MYLISVILPLLFVTVSGHCPPDISPCTCIDEEEDGYIEIECQGPDFTKQDLRGVLNSIDRNVEVLLVLHKLNLGALPSNFFAGVKILKIEIEYCEIESLASDGRKPFTGLENILGELDIIQSVREENRIDRLDLSHLRYFTDLDLTKNAVTRIDDDTFGSGPTSLIRLILSNNGIQSVSSRAFHKLKQLDTLVLEGNRFPEPIVRSMFPNPANKLEELELNNNGIRSIPEDLFTNMPALKKLSLKGNSLLKLDERTYKPVWERLELIDIRENPLECDSSIEWSKHGKKPIYILGKCASPHDKKDLQLEDVLNQ